MTVADRRATFRPAHLFSLAALAGLALLALGCDAPEGASADTSQGTPADTSAQPDVDEVGPTDTSELVDAGNPAEVTTSTDTESDPDATEHDSQAPDSVEPENTGQQDTRSDTDQGDAATATTDTTATDSTTEDSATEDSATPDGATPDTADPPVGAFPYTPCEPSAFPAPIAERIQTVLDTYPDVPGVVVSFHHPDHGYVSAAFGLAHLASETPLEPDAIFDLGSVHKLFKWILLEQLGDLGLLTHDDPISAHLAAPSIPGATLRHLTQHSTGMVDIGANFYGSVVEAWQGGTLPAAYTYAQMMDFLAAETQPGSTAGLVDDFALGETHHYSSYGPLVAGNVAEAVLTDAGVAGTSLDYIQAHIIEALNLPSTTFIGFDPTPADLTQGYGSDDGTDATAERDPPPDAILKAVSSAHEGALFSTACDMLNFVRAINDPSLGFLAPQTIASRHDAPIDVYGFYNVGRGVMNYHGFGAGDFWGHAGDGMSGHSSMIGFSPSRGVSAAIHANLRPLYITDDYGLHHEILGVLHEELAP